MSNNEWYGAEAWYAPQETAGEPGPREKKKEKKPGKGWTPLRITGLLCVLAALIVASSLYFAGTAGSAAPAPPVSESTAPEEMPGDPFQFFQNFYEKVQVDIAEIDIERAELPIDFSMRLWSSEGEPLDLQALYARCSRSIVAISGFMDGKMGYNWGTGVILSEDGLILTNTHVIDGCDRASVKLWDDSEYEAKLVGADSISDIALLKIEAEGLPAARFGESGSLQVGDRVAAIGNPLGEDFRNTLTDGIISAIERGVQYNGHSMTLLQTNTALNEGNSGGALFNMYGQVVGVTNMKMMSAFSSIEGIGFAIPSATVRSVVNALVKDGEVRGRPSIGITVGGIPDNARERYDMPEGLYVSEVTEGSDAAAKGVRPGDVITAVNGVHVTTTEEVSSIKNQLAVGDSLTLSIWRAGEELEIEVVLVDTNDIYG